MDHACMSAKLDTVEWLIENFDIKLFDIKEAMNKACIGGKLEIVKWLLENCDKVDPTCFDLQSIWQKKYNKMALENVDQSSFTMNEAFQIGCKNEQQPVVRWMIENVPIELLNISNALHTVCPRNTNNEIVQMLLQHIDVSKVYIDLIIREACNHGNIAITKYFLNMTDVSMIDMNQAMTNILSIDVSSDSYSDENEDEDTLSIDEEKQQLAMTIIQKTTLSVLNIDELIIEICKNGWLELLQLLWLNNDHSNMSIDQSTIDIACEYGRENIVLWAVNNLGLNMINVKALMTESCGFGWLAIVKKIWTTVEHGQFDIKSAMNGGCSYGRVEVVTWLLQNADNNLFDINVIIETSCRNGWIDIIKHILPLDLSACNATAAITAACTTGNVEFVQ
ncbi:unnamed protein product [Mytilus edulis]|uniref:Ankyrin repeat protein n=1 Tax=Mytilus edulis TaxID=6550 RepID=A0A8S3PYF8_MYTED|nr:unnamed protein product [Mytilus edulis]